MSAWFPVSNYPFVLVYFLFVPLRVFCLSFFVDRVTDLRKRIISEYIAVLNFMSQEREIKMITVPDNVL